MKLSRIGLILLPAIVAATTATSAADDSGVRVDALTVTGTLDGDQATFALDLQVDVERRGAEMTLVAGDLVLESSDFTARDLRLH